MKYRIEEVKGQKITLFYPQYKVGLFGCWHDIGRHPFAETIFNSYEDFNCASTYVLKFEKALDILKAFKEYFNSNKKNDRFHYFTEQELEEK